MMLAERSIPIRILIRNFCVLYSVSKPLHRSSFNETTEKITKLINEHPFLGQESLQTLLQEYIQPLNLSTIIVEDVLGRLFSGHSNGFKALEFFKFALRNPNFAPNHNSFDKMLHILVRMRSFEKIWEFLEEVREVNKSLITQKSISIILCKYGKYCSFEDTLDAFNRLETILERKFGVEEFNVLLSAFCTQRQMKEARAVFHKLHTRFPPNTRTMNILLLGFKESGNVAAIELFYHELIRRGFKPNGVTYNIRIEGYCKKRCLSDALRLLEEMERSNCTPTLETLTSLIHGAGIVGNCFLARRLFDEMPIRNLKPDIGCYNALLVSFVRTANFKGAEELMDEMEETVGLDNVTYSTIFWGLKKYGGLDGIVAMYKKMVSKRFVPKMNLMVMLMKIFCEKGQCDLGLELWNYMIDRGCCPHGHALDLLITGLCCRGRVEEAYNCFKQMVDRGRYPLETGFRVLERFLLQTKEIERLKDLDLIRKNIQSLQNQSKGLVLVPPDSSGYCLRAHGI